MNLKEQAVCYFARLAEDPDDIRGEFFDVSETGSYTFFEPTDAEREVFNLTEPKFAIFSGIPGDFRADPDTEGGGQFTAIEYDYIATLHVDYVLLSADEHEQW